MTTNCWRGHEHPSVELAADCTDVIEALRRAFEHQKTCNWQCEKCLALLELYPKEQ